MKLYKDLMPAARAYLRKQGCSDIDAEDFVQEAFLRLWARQRVLPEGLELPYLLRMLKNLMIDDFRRLKAQSRFLRRMDECTYEVAAVDDRPALEKRRLLWSQLNDVSRDPKASAFLLQVKQGMSLEEIAAYEHVPIGTVAAKISRYRGRFKENYQKAWETSVWC